MITKEMEAKVKQNEEASANEIKTDSDAVEVMKKLSDFCLSQDYCNTCPFYHKERGYNWWENYDCLLTRTDNFTPADWEID